MFRQGVSASTFVTITLWPYVWGFRVTRLLLRVSPLWNFVRGVRFGFLAVFSVSTLILIGICVVSGSSSDEEVGSLVRSTISGFDSSAAVGSSAEDESESESVIVSYESELFRKLVRSLFLEVADSFGVAGLLR